MRGRAVPYDPPNRFEAVHLVPGECGEEQPWLLDSASEDGPSKSSRPGGPSRPPCSSGPSPRPRRSPPTEFIADASRTVLASNQSPDVPFSHSINPYRGCEHGCVYCYARPTHEYLGFSSGLDFERKIMVKRDAPALLRRALSRRSWKPAVIGISGVTDPYQPVERRMRITRGCLSVLRDFRNPACVVTKNHLVTRDRDLLAEMAGFDCASATLSVTTLDHELQSAMEPRTSVPARRLEAIRVLSDAGVPVGVNVAPVIPGLTDHEMPAILEAAAEAGATRAAFLLLRLPAGVDRHFKTWLSTRFPDRAKKVLARIRETRGGRLDDPAFHRRFRGQGRYAEHLAALFKVSARKFGLDRPPPPLSVYGFARPRSQLDLFGLGA